MVFSFFDLPGEVRNYILRLLLTHKTPIVARFANQLAPPNPTSLHLCPHVLLVSRQTYSEGISLLYGENTFQAHPSYLVSILFAMEPGRYITSKLCVAMVRRFHIRPLLQTQRRRGGVLRRGTTRGGGLSIELGSWGI